MAMNPARAKPPVTKSRQPGWLNDLSTPGRRESQYSTKPPAKAMPNPNPAPARKSVKFENKKSPYDLQLQRVIVGISCQVVKIEVNDVIDFRLGKITGSRTGTVVFLVV